MWQGSTVLPPRIVTVDYDTGGEPFRIVAEPPVAIRGATVAERCARHRGPRRPGLRSVLCSEPRGHAGMSPNDSEQAVHPTDARLNGIYGTIWFDDLGDATGQVHQRNVAVFADGEVDRSPCGSGTCARLAVVTDEGRLLTGAVLQHGVPRRGPAGHRYGVPLRRTRVQHQSARPADPRVRAAMTSR
jgi:proline racemase